MRWRRLDMRESLCGIGRSRVQCAQLTLTPDFVWDLDFGSGCASCVAMMQPADHRESDDLPPIGGLARAEVGGVLAEREVGPGSVIVSDCALDGVLRRDNQAQRIVFELSPIESGGRRLFVRLAEEA